MGLALTLSESEGADQGTADNGLKTVSLQEQARWSTLGQQESNRTRSLLDDAALFVDRRSVGLAATARDITSSTPRSQVIAEWHGQVREILHDTFVAELRGIIGEGVEGSWEEAAIPLEEVKPNDSDLLKPGAFFRLCVSYTFAPTTGRRRYTDVIFRRLPAYRRDELDVARREAMEIASALQVE